MKKRRYSGVLVKANDKVLLCKRNNEGTLPGEWSIPSGKLNDGETPVDGAAREFFEETHLEIARPINLCGVMKRYTRDGERVKGLLFTFLLDVEEEIFPNLEEALDGEEHTECQYFTKNELPKPISEQLVKLIETILKSN